MTFIYTLTLCVHIMGCYEGMHMFNSIHVAVRGQFVEVISSLLPCGAQGSNSHHQIWWQIPLSNEPFN